MEDDSGKPPYCSRCRNDQLSKKQIIMASEINKIQSQFEELKSIIVSHKNRACQTVNTELITTYWEVGKYVSNRINSDGVQVLLISLLAF